MPSLEQYRRMLEIDPYKMSMIPTNGEIRKMNSDIIMDATWDDDGESKRMFLFDFFHDNEKQLNRNMNPFEDNLKSFVNAKFAVSSYNSESKDQVGYTIQFRPSFNWEKVESLEYYKTDLEKHYDTEFPHGLYVAVPDEKGNYRRWLVEQQADHLGLAFPTWFILPCDYKFQWVFEGKKYECWGVIRSQNS